MRIYGPARDGERWKRRPSHETEEILQGKDAVRVVKSIIALILERAEVLSLEPRLGSANDS